MIGLQRRLVQVSGRITDVAAIRMAIGAELFKEPLASLSPDL